MREAATWEALFDQIHKAEGTGPMRDGRCFPYRDTTGHLTIGFGRNLDAKGLSIREAEFLCDNDLAEAIGELADHWPWTELLDDVRWRVLVDMVYNLGFDKLMLEFWPTIEHIKNGAYADAASHMRSTLWYRQVGTRGERLAVMMETGNDPAGDVT